MKNAIFKANIYLLLPLLLLSCTKDRDDENSLLGAWIETAPVENRTELYFSEGNRLHRVTREGNEDVYTYSLKDRAIIIRSTVVDSESEIFFEQMDSNTIKIGNLYPSIPELEPTFMIFERN